MIGCSAVLKIILQLIAHAQGDSATLYMAQWRKVAPEMIVFIYVYIFLLSVE